MKTLDPSIRQAAQRVTAWHIDRWRAHLEAQEASTPPEKAEAVLPEAQAPLAAANSLAANDQPKPDIAA